jgi:glutaredoxin-like YruB-family protein
MSDKKVKIYSTPTCTYCMAIKKFLEKNEVEYKDFNVAQDEEALKEMKEKTGQMGVPLVEIGEDVVVGFNKKKISKLLELN